MQIEKLLMRIALNCNIISDVCIGTAEDVIPERRRLSLRTGNEDEIML